MEIARLYRDAQRSFLAAVADLGGDDWTRPVPCCPAWTVRDVLSHVAGVSIDIAEGNVAGAATDPWTAAQVERWRDTDVDELIDRWNACIDPVADAIEAFGERRPPLDCHTHEHDVRHALGRRGDRDSELMTLAADLFGSNPVGRTVELVADDGSVVTIAGVGGTIRAEGVDRFELARARSGRRSADQVRSWAWSEPLTEAELARWFVFGPAEQPIDE